MTLSCQFPIGFSLCFCDFQDLCLQRFLSSGFNPFLLFTHSKFFWQHPQENILNLFSLHTFLSIIILFLMHATLMLVPACTQHQSKGAVSLDPQETALSEAYIWVLRICLLIMACLEARYNFHFLENETYLLMIFKTFVNGHHHGCW